MNHSLAHQRAARSAMTLLEVLMSVAIAGLLLVPLWSWQTTQVRLQHQAHVKIQALREAVACQQLLLDDLALTVPGAGQAGGIQIENDHRLSLTTAAVVPGQPRGFRSVEWRWSSARGLERVEMGSPRWLSNKVRLSFRQSGEESESRWQGVWSILGDDGKPLPTTWVMEVAR